MWIAQAEYERLGKLLQAARQKADLGQKELASKLRKPQSFISAYESGQRRVDLLEFLRISSALGVDPKKLFGEIARLKLSGA